MQTLSRDSHFRICNFTDAANSSLTKTTNQAVLTLVYRELHRFYYRRKMELMKQLKEVNAEVNKYEDKMLELANLGNKVDDGNC